MQNTIYVLEGSYRNKLIEHQSFQLLKAYQPHPHKEGGYITVKIDPKETDKRIQEIAKAQKLSLIHI